MRRGRRGGGHTKMSTCKYGRGLLERIPNESCISCSSGRDKYKPPEVSEI